MALLMRESQNSGRLPANLPDGLELSVSHSQIDPEWDAFLAATPGGHHVQTGMWANVKEFLNWKTYRVIVSRHNRIVAGGQLLYRSFTPLARVGYLTKGPVCEGGFQQTATLILHQIMEFARKKNLQMLAIQPPNNAGWMTGCLSELGFCPSTLELAPVASIVLDISPSMDELLAGMKRQTRQNIRRGQQAGLLVRTGNEDDLQAFYQLHLATSLRQNFPPYAFEYYREMWRIFKPAGSIAMIMAEFEGQPVTALLLIPFGDTVIAKILGWSGQHAALRPNDAVFWEAISWSKSQGYRLFDFEGVDLAGAKAYLENGSLPQELQHSPDFFKLGYGGQVVIYPQAYESIKNRTLNWFYHKLSPTIGGNSAASHLLDRLRKV